MSIQKKKQLFLKIKRCTTSYLHLFKYPTPVKLPHTLFKASSLSFVHTAEAVLTELYFRGEKCCSWQREKDVFTDLMSGDVDIIPGLQTKILSVNNDTVIADTCYPSQPKLASLDIQHFSELVRYPVMIHRGNFLQVLTIWNVISRLPVLVLRFCWCDWQACASQRSTWIHSQLAFFFLLIICLLHHFCVVKVLRDVHCHLETKPSCAHYAEVMLFVVYALNALSRHWHNFITSCGFATIWPAVVGKKDIITNAK